MQRLKIKVKVGAGTIVKSFFKSYLISSYYLYIFLLLCWGRGVEDEKNDLCN